jgi:hypothetical protein
MTAIIECLPPVADKDVVLVTGASTGFGLVVEDGYSKALLLGRHQLSHES